NQAIGQMDQVTQQNAALVEQASAAAESMQEQAGKLAQVVAVFQLDGSQATSQATTQATRGTPQPAVRAAVPMSKPAVKPKAVKAAGALPARRTAQPAARTTTAGDDWEEF
ncbi:MAG: methyl-accepting chemotaxis protein, partial [Burkholderiaceae bacterium]